MTLIFSLQEGCVGCDAIILIHKTQEVKNICSIEMNSLIKSRHQSGGQSWKTDLGIVDLQIIVDGDWMGFSNGEKKKPKTELRNEPMFG